MVSECLQIVGQCGALRRLKVTERMRHHLVTNVTFFDDRQLS